MLVLMVSLQLRIKGEIGKDAHVNRVPMRAGSASTRATAPEHQYLG